MKIVCIYLVTAIIGSYIYGRLLYEQLFFEMKLYIVIRNNFSMTQLSLFFLVLPAVCCTGTVNLLF